MLGIKFETGEDKQRGKYFVKALKEIGIVFRDGTRIKILKGEN